MNRPTKDQIKTWLAQAQPVSDLRAEVQRSRSTPTILDTIRQEIPDLTTIPPLTYTDYRRFEHVGSRGEYETPYHVKRSMLTRATLEYVMGQTDVLDYIHDLMWSICEETTWVLPAHEEQGPLYWDISPPPFRTTPLGAHTMLTREPDSIDLFAAETGASLAEALHVLGDALVPEVRQRVRQEIARRIFKPYLAYARHHWWFKGALNWNGVCNGAVGLAFLRLEQDQETLAEALALVLEGFEAYLATGFEADGGSIEGVGYWNYGLMYYVIVAELLREITGGAVDLLAQPRLKDIAAYPVGMALNANSHYINYGDAPDEVHLAAGIVTRLAQRTGVDSLRTLLTHAIHSREHTSVHAISKLAVIMRLVAWWDINAPVPAFQPQDFYLPETGIVKFATQTESGQQIVLATKAGYTDGHHAHTDIATFIVSIDGESLLPDPGRGLYSKDYFRQGRYDNIFNNSYSHSVPRIGGHLQAPGPEFGGVRRFHGKIVEHTVSDSEKRAVIEFHTAYDLPQLALARRTLELDTSTGAVSLSDVFAFADGDPLPVEEAFTTWADVSIDGATARITGANAALTLTVIEPAGAAFAVEVLEDACRANHITDRTLKRLTVNLPEITPLFRLTITPENL